MSKPPALIAAASTTSVLSKCRLLASRLVDRRIEEYFRDEVLDVEIGRKRAIEHHVGDRLDLVGQRRHPGRVDDHDVIVGAARRQFREGLLLQRVVRHRVEIDVEAHRRLEVRQSRLDRVGIGFRRRIEHVEARRFGGRRESRARHCGAERRAGANPPPRGGAALQNFAPRKRPFSLEPALSEISVHSFLPCCLTSKNAALGAWWLSDAQRSCASTPLR